MWNKDERPCGGVRPRRRLSASDAPRQPAGLLELVRSAPSEPRLRRAGQTGGAGASPGEGVRHPKGACFRSGPVSGRRDGGVFAEPTRMCSTRSAIYSGLPYKSAGDVPSAFAAMKGTAAFDPAPLGPSNRHCRKIIFHGLADGTVVPINGERILEEVENAFAVDWDDRPVGQPMKDDLAAMSIA